MLSVRLESSLENQLSFFAEQNHTSKTKIIKNALVHYFEMLKKESKDRSSYELGSELFGKYSSGDGSLSTTYKQKLKEKLHAKNSHR
ncbi:MAG: hypothetical protein JJW00_06755 [Sulfurimonas sp.]|nr:hypothetical protein [Sulfurimonas sp.]